MAKTRYNEIYTALREKTEGGACAFRELLPSENILVKGSGCSRSTICRVTGRLASEGYVQGIYDKEVKIIYQPGQQQPEFILGGIESLKEAVAGDGENYTTKAVCLVELIVDETIRRRTTFPVGVQTYYIQCVRCIEGEVLIIDHDYPLRDAVRDLTPETAERSIYECMENDLGESIVTIKRKMTVEHVNQIDEKYLGLKGHNCIAVVSSMIHNKEGVMSELIQFRHRPDRFVFYDLAHRIK